MWLHWSEYLKAHEEFSLWLVKVQRTVEPQLELQLGLREKLWQVDHHVVMCSDVKAQEPLLERLLDEASALYSRTQDPSVDELAQNNLHEAYNNVRTKAEVCMRYEVSQHNLQLQADKKPDCCDKKINKVISAAHCVPNLVLVIKNIFGMQDQR